MSWWTSGGATGAVAVYQPIGAASLAASYSNLANPGTYDAAPGVAPSFDTATGWTFNGTTQYLTTGVTPARDQTWSLLVRYSVSAWPAGFASLCGAFEGASGFLIQGANGSSSERRGAWSGTNYFNGGSSWPLSGVMGFSARDLYADGTATGEIIASGTTSGNHNGLFIGALSYSGGHIQEFPGDIQAVAIYNTTLDASQVAAVSAAMAALPTVAATDAPLPPLFAPNLAMRAY